MTSEQEFYSNYYILESLLKNTRQNAVIIIQIDGRIITFNNAFTEQFGYELKDLVGKSHVILYTEEDQKKGLPKKERQQVLITGQANDSNYLVNKNKEAIWVSGESVLVKNKEGTTHILKIVQNIHQQKTSDITIQQLNSFNESILSKIKDVVLVLDNNLNVIKVNDASIGLFNTVLSYFFSLNLVGYMKQFENNKNIYKKLQKAVDSKTGFSNYEIEIAMTDGNKKCFEITCTPLLNSDGHLLLTVHDITIYKTLEKEREDVIGFIVHELRNPLSNLLLSDEMMREAIKENDITSINDTLLLFENNVKRMNNMITGLYQSAKVNSGNFLLEFSEFDFGEMVKEAIATVQISEPSFLISVSGGADLQVIADRYRIIQVITNYLSNAIKYANGHKEIRITILHDNQTVTVSVKDESIGISKENLPHIFDRYFRTSHGGDIEGIGLGLYLCNGIIRAHKGEVWVESEENKGSVFCFSIPLKPE